eukprot:CAMPEP_0178481778 /NCGR_PEP_ID=MMETSP0696-20121128/6390_1 /TAXON_ID=265572 /ORGANISM="Extubocellulus spinifer, Strain CCMP396" /LENGTH=386 /DNA_ID=CAMNT_0020109267 /DNA_START=49 /DNA_END=1206 /DNA_ORIENTATION=-
MSHNHNHHHQQKGVLGLGKSAPRRIHEITGSQVQSLLAKLQVLYHHLPHLANLPLQELTSSEDYTAGEVLGGGKHVLQESSILCHLRRVGALDVADDPDPDPDAISAATPLTAIEFGAGTGRLSERLQRSSRHRPTNHVLIDRQDFSPSQCRDGAMRNRANDGESILRIVGDIAEFDISKYCRRPDTGTNERRDTCAVCLCMSKHLCGPACDLAIATLGRVAPPSQRPPFAFATCCHYLCTWDSFAGRDYWVRLGLTEEDFEVAITASQWYSLKGTSNHIDDSCVEEDVSASVIGSLSRPDIQLTLGKAGAALEEYASQEHSPPSISSEDFELTFSRGEKAKLGCTIKRLLDLTRAAKLQELGYDTELVKYTTWSIENRLLVGRVA